MAAKLLRNGAPGEIRTPDLQLRRLPLYPAELRARANLHSLPASPEAIKPLSSHLLSRNDPESSLAAARDSWDRGACRSWGRE